MWWAGRSRTAQCELKSAGLETVFWQYFLCSYISRIIPGGVADRHGGLKRGDQLLSVNGVSVEGENHEKAVELLKQAIGSVKLVVRYTPKVLEEMENRFQKQTNRRRNFQ